MEKFIRIESRLINVNTIADIYSDVYNNTWYIVMHTYDGAAYLKELPEHIDTIDDIADAYIDLITSFLASKEPDELVLDLDAYDSGNMNENETKSESTENSCENCTYCDTRDDSSKFCVIYNKELPGTACDLYKRAETAITERTELTKLKVSVKFLQKYCENKRGCKGCLFSGSMTEGCRLAQTPEDWNTDCLM